MKIRCYVAEDGEVLSTTDHPVTLPLYVIPQVENARPWEGEAASELALECLKIKHKLYKAITVTIPDDYFKVKDGMIR